MSKDDFELPHGSGNGFRDFGDPDADFSRVRQAKLRRFTIDRLMAMLGRLNQDVEISVKVRPRHAA